jgi:hypothetical protein
MTVSLSMTKAELLSAAEELELQVDGLRDEIALLRESKAPAPTAATSAPAGVEAGIVMVVHLGGVGWNRSERQIVRCAPTGNLAESWMALVGGRIILNDGKQSIPSRPYHQLPAALQRRAQWSKAAAIKAALEG